MSYATYEDVQSRMNRTIAEEEQNICTTLLEDAAVMIDSFNSDASESVKKVVSCRMVIRALGDGATIGVPVGATQGSMSGLGYSQSWTVSNGSVGELYLSKLDKQLLGRGNNIGSYSPIEELVNREEKNDSGDDSAASG